MFSKGVLGEAPLASYSGVQAAVPFEITPQMLLEIPAAPPGDVTGAQAGSYVDDSKDYENFLMSLSPTGPWVLQVDVDCSFVPNGGNHTVYIQGEQVGNPGNYLVLSTLLTVQDNVAYCP